MLNGMVVVVVPYKKRRMTTTTTIILFALVLLLLFYAGELIFWNLLYNHAFSAMKIFYILNTKIQCDIIKKNIQHNNNNNNYYYHSSLKNTTTIPEKIQTTTWESLITNHVSSKHNGWLIARHPVELGLCNRILDITSLLILAIATNRTLWIDWEEHPQYYLNEWETIGMTKFDQLFNSSSFNKPELKPPEDVLKRAKHFDKSCFIHHIAVSNDLDADLLMHKEEAIISDGYDWWGGLLLKNRHYKQSHFNGLNFSTGFPILFKTLFGLAPLSSSSPLLPLPLLHPVVQEPVECNWVIQYRVKRPRPKWLLIPIDNFINCAKSKGMTPQDYKKTWIVTDDVNALLEHASPQSRHILSSMNLPLQNESCRGPCGDRVAVETMYKLSQCKRAVLTFGSSFGSCITSLAGIRPVYRVGRLGECDEFPSDEPYDMNTVSKFGNTATYISSTLD